MSTFVLKKEYELKMPINYIDINKTEMEYIDGGGTARVIERSIDKRWLSMPINAIGWFFNSGLIGGAIGKCLSLIYNSVVSAIGNFLMGGAIAKVMSEFTGDWSNFGDHLANYVDSIDIKPNNGRLDYQYTIYC